MVIGALPSFAVDFRQFLLLNIKPHSGHWKRAETPGVDEEDDVVDDAILLEAENIDGPLGEPEVFAADNESSFDPPAVN